MPTRKINGCDYYYEVHGTGQETVVLAHGLLLSGRVWHNQLLALRDRFRCIEFDFRGHGRSSSPAGGYAIDELAGDLCQLLETNRYTPCHLAGVALGGVVALRLALKRPELVRSLTLISASADEEAPESRRRLKTFGTAMRFLGPKPFTKRVMSKVFAPVFSEDSDRKIQFEHWVSEFQKQDRSGLSQAIHGFANRVAVGGALSRITQPTLIVAGQKDSVFPPEHSKTLHHGISGSRYMEIPEAGHCPPLETPAEVNQALLGFFGTLPRVRNR